MLPFDVPAGLLEQVRLGPRWMEWLEGLPHRFAALVDEWELAYDGPPTHGFCALVAPVRMASGRPAVLKVGFPDDESEHEHLALKLWHGNGTVQLLRADPYRYALLLERLHPEDLTDVGDLEACEIVASFYRRIHVPAPPPLRTLTSYVEGWAADLAELPKHAPIPRRLVEQALALDRQFLSDEASDGTVIHGDLHYENVLAGDREPWLVIDPKPMSGDPHYEVAPMLWNRWDEVVASGNVRDTVRRRFHTVVDAAGLDEDRARDWVVVRMIHNAMWGIQDVTSRLDDETREWISGCVTIAKAVQG